MDWQELHSGRARFNHAEELLLSFTSHPVRRNPGRFYLDLRERRDVSFRGDKSNAPRLEMKRLDGSAQTISIELSDGILFRGMESLWLYL